MIAGASTVPEHGSRKFRWLGETPCASAHAAKLGSGDHAMRGILLWLLGIPIPVVILLYLFHVI
ncbi:MAG TPA: hypothetical protein VMB81_03580 [Candidatus Sulfotelmatobacter sp.]|nr:hypothetical protein [Candidatus Sulfotelmatobacter sp.]